MVAKYPLNPFHITQIRHPIYNPSGDEASENCGPTSLAIACMTLGKKLLPIPGFPEPTSSQDAIDSARYWMFTKADGRRVDHQKAGVKDTPSGPKRCATAHMTLVNLPDLELGAKNLGLTTRRIETWESLNSQFHVPNPVLLAGDPCRSRAYCELLDVDYTGGHITVLLDRNGERFLVSDPLSAQGPSWVTQSALEEFAACQPLGTTLGLHLSLPS